MGPDPLEWGDGLCGMSVLNGLLVWKSTRSIELCLSLKKTKQVVL